MEPSVLHGKCVVVMGAGPAGLATCLGLLCNKNFHVEKINLVEKQPIFTPSGASLALAPNGQKAIDELCPGMLARLEDISLEFPGGGLLLPWWELRDTLLEEVKSFSNVDLHMGKTLKTIHQEGDDCVVELSDGTRLVGDMVVGADGVHSQIRSWLGLPPASRTGSTTFRGHIIINGDDNPLGYLLERGIRAIPFRVYGGGNGKAGVFVMGFSFHPKFPGKVTWVVSTTESPYEGMTPLSVLEGKVEDEEEWEMLQEIFRQSELHMMEPYPQRAILGSVDSWGGKGRVTLLGDAAHAISPVDGLGASMAFEDAVVLCRSLAKGGDSLEDILRSFETSRLPRVQTIHENQAKRSRQRMLKEKEEKWTDEFKKWVYDGV
mmetsp:Transcript_24696/g.57556  ORF Transcript_24696/g.57556 Transcript_24696/m.57556 type:complete len:377 (+) Transcript_24696:2396-3526(+)